jgi:glycosyltransferase involved in cell wall biosynthesis
VVILPSASLETFGQVIIEAFAHGTPALSSRSGAGRELIEASGAGYSYATLDELRQALAKLADADLRDDLGNRGLDYLESAHSESAYMQRYEALVEEHRA